MPIITAKMRFFAVNLPIQTANLLIEFSLEIFYNFSNGKPIKIKLTAFLIITKLCQSACSFLLRPNRFNIQPNQTKEGKIMLKKQKQQKSTNAPLHNKNEYSSFDDFIDLMLTCSQDQFESTYFWFREMREKNIKIN